MTVGVKRGEGKVGQQKQEKSSRKRKMLKERIKK
jgi:hypothetical protein